MLPEGLLSVSQVPSQICLIKCLNLKKLKIREIYSVHNKDQVFKVEREVHDLNYISADKAEDLP